MWVVLVESVDVDIVDILWVGGWWLVVASNLGVDSSRASFSSITRNTCIADGKENNCMIEAFLGKTRLALDSSLIVA